MSKFLVEVLDNLIIHIIFVFLISVNPLTGEMIGSPGSFIPEEKPVPYAERTPGTRIPPGGYTTPLW